MAAKTVYDDERYKSQASKLDAEKKAELNEVDVTYGNMISGSDKYYNDAINKVGVQDANGNWNQGSMAQIQTDVANKNLEFAIDEIEQNKQQAHKDYIKEQSGAYVDWQKQSNPYGVEAEKRASAGLAGAGYAESSLVSMHNTYQNRVATARESYNLVVQNYNNAITEARLQNSAKLAEIAINAMQKGLELSLEGFQYKNTLVLEQAKEKRAVEASYYTRYQDIVEQINREDALAEEKRQADLAQARHQAEIQLAREQFEYQKQQDAAAAAATAKKAAQAAASAKAAKSKSAGGNSYSKKVTQDEKKLHGNESGKTVSAEAYLNQLIASGASKDKVSNEIAIALREGAITKAQATKLRQTFTPRGLAY